MFLALSSHVRRVLLTCVACLAWAAMSGDATLTAAPGAAPPFADCEPRPGQDWTYDNLMCLRQVGITHGARDEVVRRLRAMGGGDAEHPWPTLVLAHVTLDQLQRPQAIAPRNRRRGFARRATRRRGHAPGLANQCGCSVRRTLPVVTSPRRCRRRGIRGSRDHGARAVVERRSRWRRAATSAARIAGCARRSPASPAAPIGLRRAFSSTSQLPACLFNRRCVDALRTSSTRCAPGDSQQDAAMVGSTCSSRLMLSERRQSGARSARAPAVDRSAGQRIRWWRPRPIGSSATCSRGPTKRRAAPGGAWHPARSVSERARRLPVVTFAG